MKKSPVILAHRSWQNQQLLLFVPLVFAVMGVLLSGAWLYHSYQQNSRQKVNSTLASIAQLKVEQIAHWRDDILANAGMMMESQFLPEAVKDWLANPQPEMRDRILARLHSTQKYNRYHDVALVNTAGQVLLSVTGEKDSFAPDFQKLLAATFAKRQTVLSELYLPPEDPEPHLDAVAPIFADGVPLCAVVLRHGASENLFPLLKKWPTESRSAETLLVRREGNMVLYLSEARHRSGMACKSQIPLNRLEVPAVRAILGKEGIFEGKDYRDVPVLTSLRLIPNSPWAIETKIDKAEAMADWQSESIFILTALVALLLWLSACAILIWVQRNRYREIVQCEITLDESNRQLEQALTELKQTQEQLIQQAELRGLGQMASGIAHDFNNALSPIIGFSELLIQHPEKRSDPVLLVKWLKNIQTCATDAAAVVRQLGQFSRQKIGSQALAPVDLNQLILQVVEFTQPRWKDQMQATGNTIRIVTDLRPVPPIPGEASGLRELLINLIFNAVEASPTGGTITLCTAAEDSGVRIQVRDTGQGMTEEVRQRCLEPFFTTKGPDGKGLGLSMAHSIVQRHNGKMAIESSPSQGTTITIQLPLPTGTLPVPIVSAVSSGSPLPPLTVLVVDDQASLRDVVTEYLTTEGHTVTSVETGTMALKQIQNGRFNLVITDKAMPEMNGEQLAAAIHLIAPQLPVILMTGFGDSMIATGTMPAHICVILSKPITKTSLRNALAKALSRPLVN